MSNPPTRPGRKPDEGALCCGGGNVLRDEQSRWWSTFFFDDEASYFREKAGIVHPAQPF